MKKDGVYVIVIVACHKQIDLLYTVNIFMYCFVFSVYVLGNLNVD